MIINDKKQVQQKSNILANLILWLPSQNNLIIQNLSSNVKWNKFSSKLELNGSLLKWSKYNKIYMEIWNAKWALKKIKRYTYTVYYIKVQIKLLAN